MATIATRNSTFTDAATPARPIAKTTSARKTADRAPAAQIGMVKVPIAASTSSIFSDLSRSSRSQLSRACGGKPGRGGGSTGANQYTPAAPSTAANHRVSTWDIQLIAPPLPVGHATDLAAVQEFASLVPRSPPFG